MKKNLLSSFALAIALGICAFSNFPGNEKGMLTVKYASFDPNGTDEMSYFDYTLLDVAPFMCPSTGKLCYFILPDLDNDFDVDEIDFIIKVDQLDTDNDGVIHDDQDEGITPGYYERF